jgi:hypothetical protein
MLLRLHQKIAPEWASNLVGLFETLSFARGSTDGLPRAPIDYQSNQKIDNGFISNCWRGNVRLYKAYWGLGLILGVFSILLSKILDLTPLPTLGRVLIFSLSIIPIQLLFAVAVWRSAFNTSFVVFAYLARLSVLSATAFTIFFEFRIFSAIFAALNQ